MGQNSHPPVLIDRTLSLRTAASREREDQEAKQVVRFKVENLQRKEDERKERSNSDIDYRTAFFQKFLLSISTLGMSLLLVCILMGSLFLLLKVFLINFLVKSSNYKHLKNLKLTCTALHSTPLLLKYCPLYRVVWMDGCSANIGIHTGAIRLKELKIGDVVQHAICSLHLNELGIWHIRSKVLAAKVVQWDPLFTNIIEETL